MRPFRFADGRVFEARDSGVDASLPFTRLCRGRKSPPVASQRKQPLGAGRKLAAITLFAQETNGRAKERLRLRIGVNRGAIGAFGSLDGIWSLERFATGCVKNLTSGWKIQGVKATIFRSEIARRDFENITLSTLRRADMP
jgi:hypothetical protein